MQNGPVGSLIENQLRRLPSRAHTTAPGAPHRPPSLRSSPTAPVSMRALRGPSQFAEMGVTRADERLHRRCGSHRLSGVMASFLLIRPESRALDQRRGRKPKSPGHGYRDLGFHRSRLRDSNPRPTHYEGPQDHDERCSVIMIGPVLPGQRLVGRPCMTSHPMGASPSAHASLMHRSRTGEVPGDGVGTGPGVPIRVPYGGVAGAGQQYRWSGAGRAEPGSKERDVVLAHAVGQLGQERVEQVLE